MSGNNWFYKIELSSLLTVVGIIFLFSFAVIITLIAPRHVDPTWVQPTSSYQVQMYRVADPHLYYSRLSSGSEQLQAVHHLQNHFTLLAFTESTTVKIIAPETLQKYVTEVGSATLNLTSRLLLLRQPENSQNFAAVALAEKRRTALQKEWEEKNPNWKERQLQLPAYEILELYEPQTEEAFAIATTDRISENWVDENYTILDEKEWQPYHKDPGVIYVNNPREYRVAIYQFAGKKEWRYDPSGEPIADLEQLTGELLGFRSRQQLISYGEHLYAIEGCWYCHTDQTRTLIQDVVLNGSDSYPAPPSSPNEYIFQKISFLGTRRIGPDLSRVGIKRASRDWHQAHFWSPKTESKGSIMPAFQHLFDYDPRGTGERNSKIPNYEFEAIFQYLMTKGTRITPPTQAWWEGKDPIQTKEIIEGKKKL